MINYLKQRVLANKRFRKAIIRTIRQQQLSTFQIDRFPVYGTFQNDKGELLSLYKGLRSFVTPNWEKMFLPEDRNANQSKFDSDIELLEKESKLFFQYFEKALMAYQVSISGKKVLEIGAGNMLLSCMMAKKYPEAEVVSSGLESYYDDLEKGDAINAARKRVMNHFGQNLSYVPDNITESSFPDHSFDVLFSNTVLEHVDDIDACFAEMKRILRPNGIGFHIYNPFFSYNGAHTVCSTDHPWGHCVLTEQEYSRYLEERYPNQKSTSITFFRHDLNKKCLKEFRDSLEKTGFRKSSFLPETNLNLTQLLLPHTLNAAQRNYPDASFEDLLTNSVIIVFQK